MMVEIGMLAIAVGVNDDERSSNPFNLLLRFFRLRRNNVTTNLREPIERFPKMVLPKN